MLATINNLRRTLEETFRENCDPEVLAWVDANAKNGIRPLGWFPGDPYIDRYHAWCERRKPYEAEVIRKLREGDLVASGFQLPLSLEPRRVIPADLWEVLWPDFENNQAIADTLKIIKILVWAPAELEQAAPEHLSSSRTASDPRLPIALSDDGTILHIGDDVLTFRGITQQKIIKQLVEGWAKHDRMRTAQVLEKANSGCDTFAKAFRRYPHWEVLSRYLVQENGFCWLDPTLG